MVRSGIVHLNFAAGSRGPKKICVPGWNTALEGVQVSCNGIEGDPVVSKEVDGHSEAVIQLTDIAAAALREHGGTVILIDFYR